MNCIIIAADEKPGAEKLWPDNEKVAILFETGDRIVFRTPDGSSLVNAFWVYNKRSAVVGVELSK